MTTNHAGWIMSNGMCTAAAGPPTTIQTAHDQDYVGATIYHEAYITMHPFHSINFLTEKISGKAVLLFDVGHTSILAKHLLKIYLIIPRS